MCSFLETTIDHTQAIPSALCNCHPGGRMWSCHRWWSRTLSMVTWKCQLAWSEIYSWIATSYKNGSVDKRVHVTWYHYAPINIMSHYHPYRQMTGNIGTLTKGGCPYSWAFDYFWRHLEYGNGLCILHSYTVCVKSPVISHLLQGDLIIEYVLSRILGQLICKSIPSLYRG